jgi:two-component system sensor kinase
MDLPKLQQAIIYLVSNAMEELREREESLLKIKGTFADQERAVLTLWNAGPPIPEDLRERVFAPFFTTRGPEHIGLGLTIARDVVREHDGELTYDPDRGFTMELPLRNGLSDDGDRRPAGA